MTFTAGEFIEVVEQNGDWWRGRITGKKVGWFKLDYVKLEPEPQRLFVQERSGRFMDEKSGDDSQVDPCVTAVHCRWRPVSRRVFFSSAIGSCQARNPGFALSGASVISVRFPDFG